MAGKYGLRRRSITAFGARPLAVLMVAPVSAGPRPARFSVRRLQSGSTAACSCACDSCACEVGNLLHGVTNLRDFSGTGQTSRPELERFSLIIFSNWKRAPGMRNVFEYQWCEGDRSGLVWK